VRSLTSDAPAPGRGHHRTDLYVRHDVAQLAQLARQVSDGASHLKPEHPLRDGPAVFKTGSPGAGGRKIALIPSVGLVLPGSPAAASTNSTGANTIRAPHEDTDPMRLGFCSIATLDVRTGIRGPRRAAVQVDVQEEQLLTVDLDAVADADVAAGPAGADGLHHGFLGTHGLDGAVGAPSRRSAPWSSPRAPSSPRSVTVPAAPHSRARSAGRRDAEWR
jgi:hypothetical protein